MPDFTPILNIHKTFYTSVDFLFIAYLWKKKKKTHQK